MTKTKFQLMIDSGAHDEPMTRYFKTLENATAALGELPEKWHPYAWICELGGVTGAKVVRVHMKDGKWKEATE